jgi:hypothetical protein
MEEFKLSFSTVMWVLLFGSIKEVVSYYVKRIITKSDDQQAFLSAKIDKSFNSLETQIVDLRKNFVSKDELSWREALMDDKIKLQLSVK